MARTPKKEKALTPEEKLAQALVPDVEQPYRVSDNWCWVVLGSITQVIGGGTPSSGNPEYYENGNIAWITPADLSNYNDIYISNGAKSITQIGLDKSSARLLPRGTVCLSSRAPIGYVAIAANPLATNQGFKSFLPSPAYNPLYFFTKVIVPSEDTEGLGIDGLLQSEYYGLATVLDSETRKKMDTKNDLLVKKTEGTISEPEKHELNTLSEELENMTFARNIPNDQYYDEYVAAMHKIYRERPKVHLTAEDIAERNAKAEEILRGLLER